MEQLPQAEPQSNRVVKWICNVMIAISAFTLGIMLFLSVADVVGRTVFLHPIEGTSELIGMLLIITASLGLGYCQLVKGNINIDIFTGRFGRRGQGVLSLFSYLMSIIISIIITWRGLLMMRQYMIEKLGSTTAILGIVQWPFMLLMSLGFAWVTVIFILDFYRTVKEVFKR